MKKLIVILVVVLLSATITIGCGAPATTPAPAQPTAPKPATATPAPAAPAPASPAPSQAPAAPSTTPAAKPQPTTPQYGGVLRWVDASAPGTPLGSYWETSQGIPCAQLCLEPLCFEQADGSFRPGLATSWDIDTSKDTPGVTFHLRKGVKLHDGSDFNAALVKWNFEKVIEGKLFGGTRYFKKIEVIDDYTLKVYTTMHRNSIFNMFAKNQHYIASREAFETKGLDWLKWHMVGTGPFKQVEFLRDVHLKTVRSDNYYESGKPYLMGVDYYFVADEMTRIALYKTGGADVMNLAGNARLAAQFKSEGYKIVSQPAGAYILIPDNANPTSPWANQKAREAAEYAIDKESIAKAFGYGYMEAAYQLPAPTSPAYNPNIVPRKYDTAKAKQLLSEAGFPGGFKSKIIAMNTVNRDIIVALQSQLAAVGIQMDLDFVEPAKFMTYMMGTWDNALIFNTLGMSGNPNPTIGFFLAEPRTNFKSNQNPKGWMEQYTTIMTTPKAEPKEQQKGFAMIQAENTLIPIVYYQDTYVVSNKLMDSGLGTRDDTYRWNPQDAWLSK